MLKIVFAILIIPSIALKLSYFTNIFSCLNLIEDLNRTLTFLLFFESTEDNLTLSEILYTSRQACDATYSMKSDLDQDLCAMEMNPLALESRDELAKDIEKKSVYTCGEAVKNYQKYWKVCNDSFKEKEPACKRKGADLVGSEVTKKYILEKNGSVRKIKLALEPKEVDESCCAMVYIRNCIDDAYAENCSQLHNDHMKQYNDSKKFVENSITLFGCDEETCSGNWLKVGPAFWFAVVVVILCQ